MISQEYLKGSEEKQSHIKAPAVPPPLYTFTSQQTFLTCATTKH